MENLNVSPRKTEINNITINQQNEIHTSAATVRQVIAFFTKQDEYDRPTEAYEGACDVVATCQDIPLRQAEFERGIRAKRLAMQCANAIE